MKAMVLAAGVGSRLDPLTRQICKPLVPVFNRPCVEHLLDLLRDNGFEQILLNLHYCGERAAEILSRPHPGLTLRLEREDRLWGDAGSLRRYADFFTETFLVIGGDDLCDFDLRRLVAFHRERGALGTIALCKVEDPSHYGVARVDEAGRVLEFAEKPNPSQAAPFRAADGTFLANTGIYLFEPAVMDLIPPDVEYLFGRQVLPTLREQGQLFATPLDGYWKDVGTHGEYRQANWDCLDGRVRVEATVPEREPGLFVADDAEVNPLAVVKPPVLLGHHCRVDAGAEVGPYVILGDGCRVGPDAVLRRSILWEDVRVDGGAQLEDCVVVSGSRVGGGAAVFGGSLLPTDLDG